MGLLLGFPHVTLGWCQAALRTSYWTWKLPAQILQLKKWNTGLRSWASIPCHRLCGNINLLTAYGPKNRRICFTFTAILLRGRGEVEKPYHVAFHLKVVGPTTTRAKFVVTVNRLSTVPASVSDEFIIAQNVAISLRGSCQRCTVVVIDRGLYCSRIPTPRGVE